MSPKPQSFENHAKLVTGYHKVGSALGLAALGYFGVKTATDFSVERVMFMVLVFYVVINAFYARVFPLGVQDRLIRLEERLRMERLLPEDLRGRIDEITTDQRIGLRFASDAELPELARRVLDGELTTRKEIKAAVRDWKADDERI